VIGRFFARRPLRWGTSLRLAMLLIFAACFCASVSVSAWAQNPPATQPPAQQTPPQQTASQQTPPPQQAPNSQAQAQTQAQSQTQAQQPAPPPASLGDVARKYRDEKAVKEKNGAQPGTLYTNEGVIPKGGSNALGMGPVANATRPAGRGTGAGAGAGSSSTPNFANTIASLDDAFAKINELAALDRATLVKAVLGEDDVDFPGRAEWEVRLMAGRDRYVAQGRQLNRGMKQLLMQAKALEDSNPNMGDDDPRAKSMMNMVSQATAEAKKTSDDFQGLMDQGRALAKQALGRGN
jgi:hypothetical protein